MCTCVSYMEGATIITVRMLNLFIREYLFISNFIISLVIFHCNILVTCEDKGTFVKVEI